MCTNMLKGLNFSRYMAWWWINNQPFLACFSRHDPGHPGALWCDPRSIVNRRAWGGCRDGSSRLAEFHHLHRNVLRRYRTSLRLHVRRIPGEEEPSSRLACCLAICLPFWVYTFVVVKKACQGTSEEMGTELCVSVGQLETAGVRVQSNSVKISSPLKHGESKKTDICGTACGIRTIHLRLKINWYHFRHWGVFFVFFFSF